jgi:hypothetical protein
VSQLLILGLDGFVRPEHQEVHKKIHRTIDFERHMEERLKGKEKR